MLFSERKKLFEMQTDYFKNSHIYANKLKAEKISKEISSIEKSISEIKPQIKKK